MEGLGKSRWFCFLFVAILTSCASDEDPFEGARTLSQEDLVSLEGMQSAFNLALLYNDSLDNVAPDMAENMDSVLHYYDQQFHVNDSLFNHFNDLYSHQNLQDDHHHDEHGLHTHGHFIISDHLPGHLVTDHDRMDSLNLAHQPIHPVN